MLDFDTALDLLNKYGYTSIQVHPFVYQDGDTIGICYTYVDEEYGLLERIKIFNNAEEFEEFLQMYNWVQVNGKLHHVRMILDNYESINPKVMFLRNEKIMVEGEMFDIEAYDSRESMRVNMDPVSKVIYECGDLLLVYNEIKNRQLQYLKNIIKLKNSLRHKYYDLQTEVDKYNKIKVERNLTLLPEVTDSGINEMLEVSIKDRYNGYIAQRPSYEESLDFLKEVWELCLGLELNAKYYEAQKEENDIRNEMKVVDQKLTLMRTLNEDLKPIFGIDLISRFRKINRVCKSESTTISSDFISQQMDAVNRKYSYFDKIDSLFTSDYLREAIQNSNYADLAIKYAAGANFDVVSKFKTPLNEVASSLSVQYRDKLSHDEQSILVLYNNPKYRILCDAILNMNNFETAPIKAVLKAVGAVKGFSKIKSECYESVKKRIDDPVNQQIKNSLFSNFDFSTFETFITSLVKELSLLKVVNEKMVLNGDINMYVSVDKVEDLEKKTFVMTTNDLQGLIAIVKDSKKMVGITLLKEGTPVLYSPYYFDVGDIYSKGASPEMFIKEMVNFELLIDISDIVINIDPNKTIVAKYYSVPNIVENLSIVDDIKMSYKTTFCKYALTSKLSTVVTMNQSQAVATSVSPVVNSVFDAGTLASVSTSIPITTDVKNEAEEKISPVESVNDPVVVDAKSNNVNNDEKEIEVPKKEVVLPVVSEDKKADIKVIEGAPKKDEAKVEKSAEVPKTTVTDNKTSASVKPVTTEVKVGTTVVAKPQPLPQKTDAKPAIVQPVSKTTQPVAKDGAKTDNNKTVVTTGQTQAQVKVEPVVKKENAVTKPVVNKPVASNVNNKPVVQTTTTQAKPPVAKTVTAPSATQPVAKTATTSNVQVQKSSQAVTSSQVTKSVSTQPVVKTTPTAEVKTTVTQPVTKTVSTTQTQSSSSSQVTKPATPIAVKNEENK